MSEAQKLKQEYEKRKIKAGWHKMSKAQKKVFLLNEIAEHFTTEAIEAITEAKKDITHKDGYARVMSMLSVLPSKLYQEAFLNAMVKNGYPANTASHIKQIQGITV